MMLFFAVMTLGVLGAPDPGDTLVDFGAETLPAFVVWQNAQGTRVKQDGGHAWEVHFEKVNWPNVLFKAPDGVWDWHAYGGVAVALYNPGDEAVQATIRVDNDGADGTHHCNYTATSVPSHQRVVLSIRMNLGTPVKLWGMRGVPGNTALGLGPVLDTSKITAVQVYLPRPQKEYVLRFERIWLIKKEDAEEAVALPFIDRFGQYKHADWPGKLKEERELAARRDSEEAVLAAQPALPGMDRFGGWAAGPQLPGTGWFRTEQVDGKWWLVTPEGRLFLSIGMDYVGMGEHTFVERRQEWFEWLPGVEETPFNGLYQKVSGAHIGADVIGGKGRTFSFYTANVMRKYGDAWPECWRNSTYARLRSWGFNTISNCTRQDVIKESPLPFTISVNVDGVRVIKNSEGYWAKMKDVYDPGFAAAVDASLKSIRRYSQNPLCIGYFVDNELAWEKTATGTLNSPAEQPCRKQLIKQLRTKYKTIDALNAAWGVTAANWNALKAPATPNAAAQADLDAFLHAFAIRYFETVRAACRKYAPNQLYLGCRFAIMPEPAVRAAADVVDVVSCNLYFSSIPAEQWSGKQALGKPILIGEFQFGALDRGMFHTGLVPVPNQQERAEAYVRYLQSIADHPAFVGCHWFQYVDEPNTGRWYDGENYNIGFLDVTDTPYPEMIGAARSVHAEVYTRRYAKK